MAAAPPAAAGAARAGSAAAEHDRRYPGWRVALGSALGIFCWAIPPFSFAVFLRPIAAEFGWSRESVSAVFGVAPLIAAAALPWAGYLIDRVGARRVIVPSLVLSGLAFTLRAYIEPPLWRVVALFAVTGLAAAGTSPIAYAGLVSSWFDARRGLALGIAVAGSALGTMLHPPLAQLLIDRVGWRSAHLVLGAFMLCVGVPAVAALVRPRPAPAGAPAARAAAGATVQEGLSSRLFWVLAIVLLIDSFANSSITIHLPALLSDRGVPPAQAAVALSAMGAAAVAGRLTTGWLIDRMFAVHISAALLVASALGVFILTSAQSLAAGTIGALLVGFGMGGEGDVTPYLLSRYFGLRSFSTLYGGTYMATAIAWAVGPTLMGRAHDATGSYVRQLMVIDLALLAAAALMLTLPRYRAGAPQRTAAVASG